MREKTDLNRNKIVLQENNNSQSQIYIIVRENLISIAEQCHCTGKEHVIGQANNSHIFLEFQNSTENGLIADLYMS